MKITIDEKAHNNEIEVIIKGSKDDDRVKSIYQALLYYDQTILGKINNKYIQIPLNQIYYFDTIEDKTFAYTKDQIYDINHRLYQLEDILSHTPFLRVNKNTIVNIKKIRSFHSTINGRMEGKLVNKERVKISRRYVKDLKAKLGGL
ncbi:MAG: LytTR family DNA-binding domain-containing protein [Candidatus Izemoplasmatales bacterium]